MNDKQIRSILVNYLKASGEYTRIYQEKSIGGAICDLMAVTDRLTGYEIKSDLDNYSRLNVQVRKYTEYFRYARRVGSPRPAWKTDRIRTASQGLFCI